MGAYLAEVRSRGESTLDGNIWGTSEEALAAEIMGNV